MHPMAIPYKIIYLIAGLEIVLRQGLKIMTNKIAEKNKRQAVIASGPSTGNKYLANEALDCTEIIDTKIKKTGQDLLNMIITLFEQWDCYKKGTTYLHNIIKFNLKYSPSMVKNNIN